MGMAATGDDKVRQEEGFPDPGSRDLEDVNTRLRQEMAHRRRAEEAHAILAAIVENSSDAIIGQKLDGTIVTWNKGAEQLFGYTVDEAIGRSVTMLAPQGLEDETTRIVQAIRRGEVLQPFETERVRKDGRRIQVSLTVSPIRDSDGRIVGASRISRDITHRRQIEQALRESEAKARGILDTAVDAIITIDSAGVIESFNRAAERLFGYSPRDVVGQNVRVLMPDPDRSQHDTYLRNYLVTGRPKIIGIGREVVAQRKDGTLFPADLAVSEVRVGNRVLFTGIVRDISERKRLEQEILDISDREKRRIGQDLHDSLGQLLTGIGFKSKSLENKVAAKGLPEAEVAKQIAELVTQAISQARGLARGLQPVEPKPLGLMSALEELAISMCNLFKITCIFKCDEAVKVTDPAAATHLYRIAQEACNNAIKHGHAGQVIIELTRTDGTLVLNIRDDGEGFCEPQPGVPRGMGLHIMRYRAAMIGGSIHIGRNSAGGTIVSCQSKAVQ
jgi:two-component system, LuxR family, sensor kinase FixL